MHIQPHDISPHAPTHRTPTTAFDVDRVRAHFDFVAAGRVVTNNAASTQPPRELVALLADLMPGYENVHRGQSSASQRMTELFEGSFDTIAGWVNAPSRASIVCTRNTTEAINAVMYSLLSEFRDGDNVVTTMLEHNSNFVPWWALCNEILPRFGRRVSCRVARFDHTTGQLDLEHLASLVDARTKIVCCTGASNFLGTKPPLGAVREIANGSGYTQPGGDKRSLLLVDAAQLVPSSAIDVAELDVDYLAFSFHKMLAPFGVGVLYAKEHLLARSLPFLYGGDMIAEGQVSPQTVTYNELPWKYAAGTPNILGVITSAQALRLLIDLVTEASEASEATGGTARAGTSPPRYFRSTTPIPRTTIETTMTTIRAHTQNLTADALDGLTDIHGLTVHGPTDPTARTPLVAFTLTGHNPMQIAQALNEHGIESRAGCHCATLAHKDLGLDPPASTRLSFALYNNHHDINQAIHALQQIARRGPVDR
jgi:cysteine desulfurase / selenocysteine lyase